MVGKTALAVLIALGILGRGAIGAEVQRDVTITVGNERKTFNVTLDPVLGLDQRIPDEAVINVLILKLSIARGVSVK